MRRQAFLLLPLALAALGLWLLLPHGDESGPRVPSEAPTSSGTEAPGAPATVARPDDVPTTSALPPPDDSIAGRVRDAAGAPVVGASVLAIEAAAKGGTARRRTATTDDAGRFALLEVAAGRWTILVESPDFLAASLRDVAPGRTDVEVTLASRGWLEATLLGPDGAPHTGDVDVSARFGGFAAGGASADAVPGGATRTVSGRGPDGVVRVRGLAPGLWRVEATTKGDPPLVSADGGADASVVDGQPSSVTVRLVRAGRLEGGLADEATGAALAATLDLRLDGRPASSGAVRATAEADAAGRWSADGLAAGAWTIAGRAGNGAWVRDRVDVPVSGVVRRDLIARAGGTVRVKVALEDGGPAAGVGVVLTAEDGTWKEPADATKRARSGDDGTTDASGVLVRTSVPPGRLRVETRADDLHAAGSPVIVDVPSGGTVEAEVVAPGRRRRGG